MTDVLGSDCTVYIPTYGRVGKQTTYGYLHGTRWEQQGRVVLVAVPDEVDALQELRYNVIACPAQGIGPTRQWILDQHDVDSQGDYLIMMDDDLRFARRRFDDPTKFAPCQGWGEHQYILSQLRAGLDRVPLMGLDNRSGANRRQAPVQPYGRAHDLHAVRVSTLRAAGVRYDRIRFMEDFDVLLQLLTQGLPTALLTTHTKDDVGGSNAAGGCSLYRDNDGQAAAARALQANFPQFVTVVEKPGQAWGGGMENRLDVRVQWAKAAKAGRENRELLGLPAFPEPDWSGFAPEWEIF